MFKYIKNYALSMILSNWIQSSDPVAEDDSFFHHRNINLIPKIVNNFKLISGHIDEAKVELNWSQILRYWTEIKSKYHLEELELDFEDEDEEMESFNTSNSCCITIRNSKLFIETAENSKSHGGKNFNNESDAAESVVLIRDFCTHIVSQFRLVIENVEIVLDNSYQVNIPQLIIFPEMNGIRRLQLKEDASIVNDAFRAKIQKSTELSLIRELESQEVRINITCLHFDLINPNGLLSSKSCGTKSPQKDINFDINVMTLYFKFGPFKSVFNDVVINHNGNFAIGHFQGFWKDKILILDTPIQTHNVTGNYKNAQIFINESVNLNIENKNIIKELIEIMQSIDFSSTNNNNSVNKENFKVTMSYFYVNFEKNWEIALKSGSYINGIFTVEEVNVGLKHSETRARLQDLKYQLKLDKSYNHNDSISPFSDILRFIENVELLTLENGNVLYERFTDTSDNLSIENVDFVINAKDLPLLALEYKLEKSNRDDAIFNLLGSVKEFDIKVKLTDSIVSSKLKNVDFLIQKDLLDFRVKNLINLHVNDKIICEDGQANFTKYKFYHFIDANDFNLRIPIELKEALMNDLILLKDQLGTTIDKGKNDLMIQAKLENLKIKINSSSLVEPVDSELKIREIVIKTDEKEKVAFVDSAKMILNSKEIFDSGLVRIDLKEHFEIRNHYSCLNLSPEKFSDLMEFIQFWSEIISPEIEEIKPDPVFKSSEIVSEAAQNSLDNSDKSDDEVTEYKILNIEELMEEIVEEFFVTKPNELKECGMILKLVSIGLKIKLQLDNLEGEPVEIVLMGIDGSLKEEGSLDVMIRKGEALRKSVIILNSWKRGPDATSRVAIEEGIFFKLAAEKCHQGDLSGINEYNLKAAVGPSRIYLDAEILDFFTQFGADVKTPPKEMISKQQHLKGFIFFNKVTVNSLPIKFDYQPALQGAEIVLPKIELRGVKGIEGLPSSIASAWIPQLKGDRLKEVLKTGLLPVRTVVKVGNGFADLILLPWRLTYDEKSVYASHSEFGNDILDISESGTDVTDVIPRATELGSHALHHPSLSTAHTAAQIRKSSKQIGVEALKLTSALATTTFELLNPTLRGSDSGAKDLQGGIQQAAKLIVALPKRQKSRIERMNLLQAVPLVIWDSTSVTIGAIAKTLQGLTAEFDNDSD